jgi:hypothetical protein
MEWGQSTSIEDRMSGLFATEPDDRQGEDFMDIKMAWAYRELTHHTEDLEQGAVFLFDPETRSKLELEINVLHLSAIMRGLQGSRISLRNYLETQSSPKILLLWNCGLRA